MANQNVTVDSTNIVVTGGRTTVNVDTNFGPQGSRGGLILYGDGKPNETGIQFPQTPQLLDWYINLKASDPEYLYIYQYQNRDSVNQWSRVFKIIPNSFSANQQVFFDNEDLPGTAVALVTVSTSTLPILSTATVPQLNIHVDLQTQAGFPIASSFTVQDYEIIEENGIPIAYALPVLISAAELNPLSGWGPLTGEATAHISINVI